MNTLSSLVLGLAGVAGLLSAQVPLTSEPHHRVVFEGAALRVLDVHVPSGETTLDHSHAHDLVTVSMTAGADTRTQTPGQPWSPVRPRRGLGHASVTEYAGRPSSHRIENVGDSDFRLFAVENLRGAGTWSQTSPLSAPATTLAIESRAFRVYDVRLGRERSQTSHTHEVPAVLVLIAGSALSDGAEARDDLPPAAPVGLKQLDRTGQWVFIPAGETHHIVRLGAGEVRLVEIERR